ELYVIGEPNGAEVLVNGKVVGRLPLSMPIRLDKGRAEVQVRAPGYVATTDTVTMVGGKREDRSYRLQREAVAVATPPPAAPGPDAAGSGPSASITATATPPSDQGGGSSLRPVAWGLGI